MRPRRVCQGSLGRVPSDPLLELDRAPQPFEAAFAFAAFGPPLLTVASEHPASAAPSTRSLDFLQPPEGWSGDTDLLDDLDLSVRRHERW